MGLPHFSVAAGEGEEGKTPHTLIAIPTIRTAAADLLKDELGLVLGRRDLREERRNLGGVTGHQLESFLVPLLCVLV